MKDKGSQTSKRNILIGISIGAILALVLLVVFFLGLFIGRRENRFLPCFGRQPMPPNFRSPDFVLKDFGHGAMGEIQTLGENTLVVRDRTGALKTVLIDNQTQIRRGHTGINFSQLKTGNQVIVLGEPEEKEGAIKARLIRVMGGFDKEATSSGMMRPLKPKYSGS